MTPRQRLAVWVAAVAGPLAAAPLRAFGGMVEAGAIGVQAAAVLGMVWLVATTPADAIRLTRGTSWGVLALGAAWIQGWSVGWAAGVVIAAGFAVAAAWLIESDAAKVRRSPWWSVALLWAPIGVLDGWAGDLDFLAAVGGGLVLMGSRPRRPALLWSGAGLLAAGAAVGVWAAGTQ
jgi:hypothetical protein